MSDDTKVKRLYAAQMLELFPPVIQQTLLGIEAFTQRYALDTEARISLGRGDVSFERSAFYAAIRNLHGAESNLVTLRASDGTTFHLSIEARDDVPVIVMAADGRASFVLPSFWFLSPRAEDRLAGFDAEAARRHLADPGVLSWRERLARGALEDDEVDDLQTELRLNPSEVAEAIRNEVRTGTSEVSLLVPDVPIYYERLVGALGSGTDLMSFAGANFTCHISGLLRWEFSMGLKLALLISPQSSLVDVIPQDQLDDRIGAVFDWLEHEGDRFSQVAGLELGLRLLEKHRSLEPVLFRMAQAIFKDDPEGGRLRLTASLIVFVDGELARTATLRDKPPFWRRLAAIAQASLIERELLAVGVDTAQFSDWASEGRGQHFFLQSLIDLRKEPRWLPDFMTPQQLKYEFLGRVAGTATANASMIHLEELRQLLLGDGPDSYRSSMDPPFAFLPGPLEGNTISPIAFPEDVAEELRQPIGPEGLSEKQLAVLVNMGLVFRIDGDHARVVADLLRQAKHQVRVATEGGNVFSLLVGLACVSAVSRSPELAGEVRILARVLRSRPGVHLEADGLLRVGMIAAASETEIEKWSSLVGEWLTEVSYENIDRATAQMMRSHVRKLCHLAPALWKTCSKAEAGFALVAGMAA